MIRDSRPRREEDDAAARAHEREGNLIIAIEVCVCVCVLFMRVFVGMYVERKAERMGLMYREIFFFHSVCIQRRPEYNMHGCSGALRQVLNKNFSPIAASVCVCVCDLSRI